MNRQLDLLPRHQLSAVIHDDVPVQALLRAVLLLMERGVISQFRSGDGNIIVTFPMVPVGELVQMLTEHGLLLSNGAGDELVIHKEPRS